jgi:cyclase
MKSLWALVLGMTTAMAFEYGLKPTQITQGVYCYFGAPEVMDTKNNGNMVNSCFVDTGVHWLVIDSGPSYMYAKEALLHVNAIKPMNVTYVINTHVHDDHWLGNGFYAKNGAKIIGPTHFSDIFHDTMIPRMAHRISKAAYEKTVPTPPTRLINTTTPLQVDNLSIECIHVDHKAHTSGDLFVYIPTLKTLFAGDLIFNDRLPSLRDGDINGWIAALEQIKSYKAEHIVGGHGVRHDEKAIDFTYNYLTQLRDAVRKKIANGVSLEDTVASLSMDAYKNSALYELMQRANVEAAYRMLEWEE